MHRVSREEVDDLLREAAERFLVPRPFRNEDDPARTDGICFCCDDCCFYHLKPEEPCDRGDFVEETDPDLCTACGSCVDVCYFDARILDDDELVTRPADCVGCSLCTVVCPTEAVEMVRR